MRKSTTAAVTLDRHAWKWVQWFARENGISTRAVLQDLVTVAIESFVPYMPAPPQRRAVVQADRLIQLLGEAPHTAEELSTLTGYAVTSCDRVCFMLREDGVLEGFHGTPEGKKLPWYWRLKAPVV